jgi:hypothetical protein
MTDAVDLAYLDALSEAELKLTRQIVSARKYHAGSQNVVLTERLKQFLGETFGGFEFRLNVVQSVIRTVTEKLSVIGFDSIDKKAIAWAQEVWDLNNLDALQDDIYEAALRDGAHYVIVDYPVNKGYPRWLPQQHYTEVGAGGDGNGCKIIYPQNDPNLDPIVAVKYWAEWIEDKLTERRTLYYADRIEKYARTGGGGDWEGYKDSEDEEWPIAWTDVDGTPLGIAVVPFYNKGQALEAADAIPLQDAANKTVIDLLSTEDQTAYRILVALGFIPTSDGLDLKSDRSNALEVEPGIIIGTTKSKSEADVKAIEPAELSPMMDMVQQVIMWLALVTDTPVSRFITTKLIASDETLKEQEAPLIAKVENRQKLFGGAITKCMALSMKLARMYEMDPAAPSEDLRIKPIWKSAQSMKERLDELTSKKGLGVPQEQLWTEIGYDQEKVATWKAQAEKRAAEMQTNLNQQPDENSEGGQDESRD